MFVFRRIAPETGTKGKRATVVLLAFFVWGCEKSVSPDGLTELEYSEKIVEETLPIKSWKQISFDSPGKSRGSDIRRNEEHIRLLQGYGFLINERGFLVGTAAISTSAGTGCLSTLLAASPVKVVDAAFRPGDDELKIVEVRVVDLLFALAQQPPPALGAKEAIALQELVAIRDKPSLVELNNNVGMSVGFTMYSRAKRLPESLLGNLDLIRALDVDTDLLHGAIPVLEYTVNCKGRSRHKVSVTWTYITARRDWCLVGLKVSTPTTPPKLEKGMSVEEIKAAMKEHRRVRSKNGEGVELGRNLLKEGRLLFANAGLVDAE